MTDVFNKRLENLRTKMKLRNIDAVLITKRENYMYLSGFTGTSAIIYVSSQRAVLLTDFRYVEQAASQSPDFEIIQYTGSYYDELNRLTDSESTGRLAFEDNHMTCFEYSEYSSKLKVEEMVPLGQIMEELRRVKDEWELQCIKEAVDIADQVFTHILPFITPGVYEIDLASEMEHHMRRLGATGPSFETIIASGKRASMPHGVASKKKIENGDIITLDFGALHQGYCSDITRTVFLGKPDKELEKIYQIVLKANKLGLETVRSGVSGREVDATVRAFIAQAGYDGRFGHGLGHGVGLEIHEEPSLSMRGDLLLQDGMVVTVEPGIYIPDLGGVRIEDIVVVRGDNANILTRSSKELIVL